MSTSYASSSSSSAGPPVPPEELDDADGDGGDRGGGGGWWSRSPGWARAVVGGGVVLLLLMVGGIAGGLVGRDTATRYGPPAGSIDVAFLQDMSTHHNQAVQMAVWERSNTSDPVVRQLAYDIESSQTTQVGSMQGWLALWDEPTSPPSGEYMGWMGMPVASMPGMASEADLARLRGSTGPALDVVFLQLMLRHHQGGTGMLADAAARAQVPVVQNLAESMLGAQLAEAQTMTRMLADRGAAPLP